MDFLSRAYDYVKNLFWWNDKAAANAAISVAQQAAQQPANVAVDVANQALQYTPEQQAVTAAETAAAQTYVPQVAVDIATQAAQWTPTYETTDAALQAAQNIINEWQRQAAQEELSKISTEAATTAAQNILQSVNAQEAYKLANNIAQQAGVELPAPDTNAAWQLQSAVDSAFEAAQRVNIAQQKLPEETAIAAAAPIAAQQVAQDAVITANLPDALPDSGTVKSIYDGIAEKASSIASVVFNPFPNPTGYAILQATELISNPREYIDGARNFFQWLKETVSWITGVAGLFYQTWIAERNELNQFNAFKANSGQYWSSASGATPMFTDPASKATKNIAQEVLYNASKAYTDSFVSLRDNFFNWKLSADEYIAWLDSIDKMRDAYINDQLKSLRPDWINITYWWLKSYVTAVYKSAEKTQRYLEKAKPIFSNLEPSEDISKKAETFGAIKLSDEWAKKLAWMKTETLVSFRALQNEHTAKVRDFYGTIEATVKLLDESWADAETRKEVLAEADKLRTSLDIIMPAFSELIWNQFENLVINWKSTKESEKIATDRFIEKYGVTPIEYMRKNIPQNYRSSEIAPAAEARQRLESGKWDFSDVLKVRYMWETPETNIWDMLMSFKIKNKLKLWWYNFWWLSPIARPIWVASDLITLTENKFNLLREAYIWWARVVGPQRFYDMDRLWLWSVWTRLIQADESRWIIEKFKNGLYVNTDDVVWVVASMLLGGAIARVWKVATSWVRVATTAISRLQTLDRSAAVLDLLWETLPLNAIINGTIWSIAGVDYSKADAVADIFFWLPIDWRQAIGKLKNAQTWKFLVDRVANYDDLTSSILAKRIEQLWFDAGVGNFSLEKIDKIRQAWQESLLIMQNAVKSWSITEQELNKVIKTKLFEYSIVDDISTDISSVIRQSTINWWLNIRLLEEWLNNIWVVSSRTDLLAKLVEDDSKTADDVLWYFIARNNGQEITYWFSSAASSKVSIQQPKYDDLWNKITDFNPMKVWDFSDQFKYNVTLNIQEWWGAQAITIKTTDIQSKFEWWARLYDQWTILNKEEFDALEAPTTERFAANWVRESDRYDTPFLRSLFEERPWGVYALKSSISDGAKMQDAAKYLKNQKNTNIATELQNLQNERIQKAVSNWEIAQEVAQKIEQSDLINTMYEVLSPLKNLWC